jgi:hypothetical protein
MKLEDLEAKLGIDPNMGEEDKLALVKEIQANIPALRAEQRVLEAKTQANLVVEAIKKIKEGLEARFDELNGIVDVKVRDITSGKDGIDGKDGKDGVNGKDGRDGISITGPKGADGADGDDGVGVQDAHIDFDGSLIITLTTGKELNVGEVVPMDVAEKIKVIGNGGGTSQSVLDSIASLQSQIDILIPSQTGNSGKYLTTNGTTTSWATVSSGSGTVTSVATSGTVNGITLTGGPITTTGTVTLGGTLDLSSPPAIGGTAAAAGTFTTLIGGGGSANYEQITGGAAGKAVQFQSLGSDAAVSLAIQSKGTGAIDLAAGSSGVNISNGGTVTALTRTATGSAYTTIPSVAISAPTTAGGVTATATVGSMVNLGGTVVSGGTGYTLNDVLTVVGGTSTGTAATLTVTGVSSGAVTTVSAANFGQYTALPTNPVSVTGGTGSSATFNLSWGIGSNPSFNITAAGSGYVEQPTVTFSGGGGSGAAAYASVGSGTIVRTLGGSLSAYSAGGEQLRVGDTFGGGTSANYILVRGRSAGAGPVLQAVGSDAAITLNLSSGGVNPISFQTNGAAQQQMVVSHTASAVNYVQVTGATTASKVVAISAQGSDADVTLSLSPKGAGTIRFGTYTGTILTPTGYITITDSGGTSRRLLVG